MPYIVAPSADFDGSGNLTTLTNAIYRPTAALTGLAGGVSYRALALSDASPPFVPEAGALPDPVLTLALSPTSITAGDTVTVTGAVANGTASGFSAISASIGEAVQTLSGSGLTRTFTASVAGTLSVMASVSVSGQTVSASATATVATLVVVSPPVLSVPIEDIVLTVGAPDLVIDLDDHFSGAVSYSVSPAVAGISLAGSTLTIDTGAAIATTAITVTASNADGAAADTVYVTVSATAPEALEDVELQRGQPAAFNILIDGTGPVAATHLPIGMVLNPTTGAVTGTPLSWEPETVVTVTRGAATASFRFAVLPKAGVGIVPPRFRAHNIDTDAVEAQGLWNGQELSATSRATLITSIATAAADTGTVAAPKYHRITYSGAPIDTDATIGPAGEAWSDQIHTVIVLSGVDAAARLTFRGRPGVLICLRDSLLSHGVTSGPGGSLDVFDCRIGPWHRPGAISFQAANGAPVQAYGGSMSVAACHIAGGFDMCAVRSCRFCSIENLWTHFINDLLNGGLNTDGGDVLVWRLGDVYDRPAENSGTNNHGDILQVQTPGTAVNLSYTDQWTIANMPVLRYSTTGLRDAGQNYLDTHIELVSVIYGITAWDGAVVYSANTQIDGLLGVPAFEAGCSGTRLMMYDTKVNNLPPGELALSNIVTSAVIWAEGWGGNSIPITGADVRIDVTGDLSTYFPDLDGVVTLDPYGNGINRFIPDFAQRALHPYSVRQMFEAFEPAAGFAAIGQVPMEDRRIFPEVWGAIPALTVPTSVIADADLTATALTLDVTSSAAEGIVYWYLTPVAGAITRNAVMQQCDPTGVRYTTETQPAASWTGVLDNKGIGGGHYRYSGGVIPQITATVAPEDGVDYYLHVLIETPEGAISSVTSQVLNYGEVAPAVDRFAVVNNAGPFFVNTGGALGANSGQITFAFRGSFDPDQGTQKFLLALGGTSMMLRLNPNRSLRLTVTDGAGNAVLAQTDTATALFAFDTDVDIVLSVDLVAGYARIWVDGVQVMNATLTAGSGAFSETATIYLLSQLVGGAAIPGASIERLTLWKTAAPAGALPGAAPVVDITGPASAANAHPWKRGADAVA